MVGANNESWGLHSMTNVGSKVHMAAKYTLTLKSPTTHSTMEKMDYCPNSLH